MSRTVCLRCRNSLRQALRSKPRFPFSSIRAYSPEQTEQTEARQEQNGAPKEQKGSVDIAALLSKPTWSVRSLLPSSTTSPKEEIIPAQLHHLLRLSALPQPCSPEEEAEMLQTLHSQLHFVRDIQRVDTEGIEPLQSIRDETEEGIRDATIGMEDLRGAFREEEIRGRNRRPRRKRTPVVEMKEVEGWDVLGTAGETVRVGGGRFFVVRSRKGKSPKEDVPREDTLGDGVQEDLLKDDTRKE
jgi:Asp-tRNA(Asn)/Glu-tRNA(Gln) amidotransferase C subunit